MAIKEEGAVANPLKVEFLFDFGSPNAYLAERVIPQIERRTGAKFDYDRPIAGLAAVDAHTLRLRTTAVDYTLLERLASLPAMAVAREAIEAAGADVMTRPAGSGPYVLKEWRKGSRIVLEANPHYRTFAFPASADPAHREQTTQAISRLFLRAQGNHRL